MTPMMFFILACLSTQINAYNNKNLMIGFDHLGLESLGLTSAEQELSDLAENIVTIQNRELGLENIEIFQNNIVVEQKTELPHHATSSHTIVKRGTESSAAAPPDNNSGYLALPIPPLPPGISKESTRLFRKPNSKLIELANNLAQKRRRHPSEFSLISGQQDILPPATNQIFELDDEPVVDPFRLTVNGHENYPNSIQDVLYTNDRPTDPPKQVIYKIVTKTPPPPPSNDSGTTKKIVYKLVTKPPPADSLPVVPAINTPKPKVIFHTRPPETIPAIVQTKPNQIPNSKKPAKNNGNQGSSHLVPGSKPALSPPKDENYYAVIPYDDITKLFELLNKHTKPMKADHPVPKKKSNSTPKPKKSHPTKKLQPKVIKRTPLGYKKKKHKKKKKKKKKVVHKCASSNSGIFAFFAFITLNINVTIDFMFSLMVTIMITGNLGATSTVINNNNSNNNNNVNTNMNMNTNMNSNGKRKKRRAKSKEVDLKKINNFFVNSTIAKDFKLNHFNDQNGLIEDLYTSFNRCKTNIQEMNPLCQEEIIVSSWDFMRNFVKSKKFCSGKKITTTPLKNVVFKWIELHMTSPLVDIENSCAKDSK